MKKSPSTGADESDYSAHATPMDIYVGHRIRMRRIELGITAPGLAEPLGIRRQQLEKLEKGTNRVSAGRLFEIAQALNIAPGWFFEDFTGDVPTGGSPSLAGMHTREAVALMGRWNRLTKEQRGIVSRTIDSFVDTNALMGVSGDTLEEQDP